jgi:hypothetical protein
MHCFSGLKSTLGIIRTQGDGDGDPESGRTEIYDFALGCLFSTGHMGDHVKTAVAVGPTLVHNVSLLWQPDFQGGVFHGVEGHGRYDHGAAVVHDEVQALAVPAGKGFDKVMGRGTHDLVCHARAWKGLNKLAFSSVRFEELEKETFLHEVEVIDTVCKLFLMKCR